MADETIDVNLGGDSGPSGGSQSDEGSQPNTPPADGGTTAEPVAEWFSQVPEQYKNEKLWEPIKSKPLPEVLKGYAEAQKLVGGSIRIPGDNAKPEEWDKFYAKLGRPEKPEGYKIERPESMPEEMWDADFEKGFRETAHRLGFNNKQVQELAAWYNELAFNRMNEARAQHREQLQGLLSEWGGAAKRNVALAKRAVETLGGAELKQFFNETGFGDSPVMVKLFAKLGSMLLEGGYIEEGEKLDGDTAMKQANDIIYNAANPDHKAYHDKFDPRHREIVDKVNKLFEQQFNRPRV